MSINAISSVNNVNLAGSKVAPAQEELSKSENLKSAGLSYEASNALKAQVLYQKPSNSAQYLENGLDKDGIIAALKDKDKMGRSFFSYKRRVANIITKADDAKLATDNFNILMNATNKKGDKLNAADVTDILMVATSINNKKMSEKLADEYGFNGGLLDDKTIASILDKIVKQREMEQFAMMQQQMMQQQMLDQQMMQQQMLDQQMMLNQQMMMTTPGFGFC